MEPRDQGKWMAEIERRLRTLEQSPRVPSLSVPGSRRGIQIDSNIGGFYSGAGVHFGPFDVSHFDGVSPGDPEPSVIVELSTAGNILYMIGGEMDAAGERLFGSVVFTDIDGGGGEFFPGEAWIGNLASTGTEIESAMTAGMVHVPLEAGRAVGVRHGFSADISGGGLPGTRSPWVIAIPL